MSEEISHQSTRNAGPPSTGTATEIVWLGISVLPVKNKIVDFVSRSFQRWSFHRAGDYRDLGEFIGWIAVEPFEHPNNAWIDFKNHCAKETPPKKRPKIHRVVRGFAMQSGKSKYQPVRTQGRVQPDSNPTDVVAASAQNQNSSPATTDGAEAPVSANGLRVNIPLAKHLSHFGDHDYVLGRSQHVLDAEKWSDPPSEFFITFCSAPGLEGRHEPMGVVKSDCQPTMDEIERLGSDSGKPTRRIIIHSSYLEIEKNGERKFEGPLDLTRFLNLQHKKA